MSAGPADSGLPELPYEAWTPTRETLHRVCQMVGKLRMALHPRKNHWWHAALYLSARGLTTGPIPLTDGDALELEIDLRGGLLTVRRALGTEHGLPLAGSTVADLHDGLFAALAEMGVRARIVGRPYELGDVTPFAEDRRHGSWDPDALERFRRMLLWSHGVLERFAGRFLGKQTPVHFFWHSFDLALTRFNGRPGPALEGADPVTREAYSHEVVSFGIWPGDAFTPEPSWYAYVYPEPEGLARAPLEPSAARWEDPRGKGHLALLSWEAVRTSEAPAEAVLAFLESAYRAGVTYGRGWDASALATPWAPSPPGATS